MTSTILRFLSLLIGIIFLFSGASKGIDILAFAQHLQRFQIPLLFYFSPIIISVEIFLGFIFILNYSSNRIKIYTILFLVILTIVFLYGYYILNIKDCSCFGNLVSFSIEQFLLKNLFLIGILLILLNYQSINRSINWQFIVPLIFSGITLLITTLDLNKERNNVFDIIGKTNKVLSAQIKSTGNELVFVFNPNCPHCMAAIKTLNKLSQDKDLNSVIGIYPEGYSKLDLEAFIKKTNPIFKIRPFKEDVTLAKLINAYPTFIYFENGVIKAVRNEL